MCVEPDIIPLKKTLICNKVETITLSCVSHVCLTELTCNMISLLKNLCWKVCIYVNVFWSTLVCENVCAGSGAVFCRKMRGMSLWSHSWTKWLPFREASYVSSPLFATIPTWWLKIDEKNKITFHSKEKLDFCMFSRKHNWRLPMQNSLPIYSGWLLRACNYAEARVFWLE